jgi:hypothetical protein
MEEVKANVEFKVTTCGGWASFSNMRQNKPPTIS